MSKRKADEDGGEWKEGGGEERPASANSSDSTPPAAKLARTDTASDVSEASAAVAASAAAAAAAPSASAVKVESDATDSSSASDASMSVDAAGVKDEAEAADDAAFEREVKRIRRQHARRIHTASLIARMQGAHGRLRERVQAYQDEMGKDADRDEPLLDINWQDSEGRTLLMHVIKLFGALCGQRHHHALAGGALDLSVMDRNGVREHLDRLMEGEEGRGAADEGKEGVEEEDGGGGPAGVDLSLTDRDGNNVLTFLANNIVVNAQCYTDWYVVTKLVAKAQERGCLDRRDPSGVSAFLHWCGSGCTPNVLQLCLDHGADIDQVDIDGNTALHKLVASSNFRALDALAKHGQDGDARALGSGFLCRPWWCLRNNAGLTVAQLASHRTHTEQGRSVQYLLQCAQRDWEEGGRPLLLRQLERVMHLHDVADLALQYIDGSGRAFSLPPAAAEENMEEVAEGAVVPPAAIALDAPAAAAGEGGAAGGAAAGGGGGGGANPALALDAEEIEEGDPFDGEPFSDDDEEDEELDLEDAGNIL